MPICRRPVANGFRSMVGLYGIRPAGGRRIHLPGAVGGGYQGAEVVAVEDNGERRPLLSPSPPPRTRLPRPMGVYITSINTYKTDNQPVVHMEFIGKPNNSDMV